MNSRLATKIYLIFLIVPVVLLIACGIYAIKNKDVTPPEPLPPLETPILPEEPAEDDSTHLQSPIVSETPQDTQTPDEDDSHVLKQRSFLPDSEHVRPLGRTLYVNDSLWIPLSASGLEFTYFGTSLTVEMIGDDSCKQENGEPVGSPTVRPCFVIEVDGQEVLRDQLAALSTSYDLLTEETQAADHTVRILKISEAHFSTCGVGEIKATCVGEIKPTAEKKYFVEFIGDSITAAYGSDDPEAGHSYNTFSQDARKSYAYVTAKNMDFDWSLVCYSGYGVCSGMTASGEKNLDLCLPRYYDKLARCMFTYQGLDPLNYNWTSPREPDVVVLMLGTNDESYVAQNPDRIKEFSKDYSAFLNHLRSLYPNAYILCGSGVMDDNSAWTIQNAYFDYINEIGNSDNISLHRFKKMDPANDGYGAGFHPSIVTHQKVAEELWYELQTILR